MSHLRSWVSTHRRVSAVALAAVLAAGATAVAVTLVAGGGGGSPRASGPTPVPEVAHAPLSDGWEAAELALPDDTFALRALAVSEAGVAPDGSFELTSTADAIPSDRLASLLTVEPRIDFDIDARGEREVRITPRASLQRETSYRFTLHDADDGHQLRSWAFQTESPLRVVQALPADKATGVPAATGIELTFTHDGVTGIEQRFHIDPPVEGRFETHKRVVVFVPKKLEYRTVYRVTLDAGVTAGDLASEEPFTFSFETGSLDEREPYTPPPSFVRLMNEASTTETPALQFMSYQPPAGDVSVEVFRYDDVASFTGALVEAQSVPQWSYWGRLNFRLDPSGLDRTASFTVQAVQAPQQNWSAPYVVFPEPLPAGFYLVQARDSTNAGTAQALLQVTDIAAYAAVSDTSTLVWVHDLATKAPIEGAKVEGSLSGEAETGDDGVAFFDTPDELLAARDANSSQYYYDSYAYAYGTGPDGLFTVEHEGRVAVVPLRDGSPIGFGGYRGGYFGRFGGGYYFFGGNKEFWNYAYTDRRLYRKDDEVRVWGIAKRRDGFDDGERVTLRIGGGDSGYYSDSYYGGRRAAPIAETTAELSETGTFEATLPLTSASPGFYNLYVSIGDETVTSTYFRVEDFVKPAYAIDITPSQNAAIAGDVVTFDIATRFFDGSPAPFTEIIYEGEVASGRATTDANGLTTVSYTAVADPQYLATRWLYARPAGPEEGEIYGQTSVHVLPAFVTFTSIEGEVDGNSGSVRGTVKNVDLSAFDRTDSNYFYYDYYGDSGYAKDPAPGVPVTARVVEVSYNRRETGSSYDFIAKLTRKTYEYTAVETDRGTFAATPAADGSFEVRFPANSTGSYRVELSAPDAAGRITRASAWVSSSSRPYLGTVDEPVLLLTETGATSDPQNYVYAPPKTYGAGDMVDLSIARGRERAEEEPDVRYLFYRARAGIRAYDVQPSSRYAFAFEGSDAPSLTIGGVQFNGRGYEAFASGYSAQYDFDERRIDVTLTSDHERYGPGDEVTIAVETKDAAGNPIATDTLLSGVDEALLRAQGEQYDDMLETLYAGLSSGIIATYVPSFAFIDPAGSGSSPGGRGGGGPATGSSAPDTGGSDPRKDFRDVTLFQSVRTDDDGRGSVTFKLPDNITSWRIAARAVDGDLRAGAGETSVPVGLPFFVEATIATEYLASDRPVIALRSYGLELDEGAEVRYRLRMPSLGVEDVSATGEAFERTELALPPLAEGVHEVTIEAESGELRDAIIRNVRVISSRLRRAEASYRELGDGVSLKGAEDGRTTVVFSDHNRGRYYDDLSRLSWNWGDRVDQMLARALSEELLVEHFGAPEDIEGDPRFQAGLYQTQDGGIALFPYADDELILSARVASLAGDRFSRDALAGFFQRVIDSRTETRERQIIALFGLASTGDAPPGQLQAAAGQADLTVRERLYLGLAALAAGDEGIAREQYRQVLLGFGEKREPYVRIRTGTDQDDILEATALAADLAAGLGDGSADALFQYTMDNHTTDLLVELDQISYLARALPRLPSEPSKFSYNLRGIRAEQELSAGASFTLNLTPDELRDLDARAVEGAIGVATFYEAPFDSTDVPRDPDISLTRAIDREGGDIAQGDLVRVEAMYELGPQALDGCYQITVFTPSGLRPVSRAQDPRQVFEPNQLYPYIVDGQRVSFCAYRNQPAYPAVYWARVVTPGDYEVEPAIMQSQQSADGFAATDTARITIR